MYAFGATVLIAISVNIVFGLRLDCAQTRDEWRARFLETNKRNQGGLLSGIMTESAISFDAFKDLSTVYGVQYIDVRSMFTSPIRRREIKNLKI